MSGAAPSIQTGSDRLLFVGVVESIVELQRIRGLVPAAEDVFHLKVPRPQRCLIEAVVSNTCPLIIPFNLDSGNLANLYFAADGEAKSYPLAISCPPGATTRVKVTVCPSLSPTSRSSTVSWPALMAIRMPTSPCLLDRAITR